MLRRGLLCSVVVALASCSGPSRLDSSMASSGSAGSEDPWAERPTKDPSKLARSGKLGSRDHGGLGGMDVQGMLAKVADAAARPGPYEAASHSAGFDDAAPHWGVLGLGGEIVERSALSWSGGRGTELRTLIDRLRELAGDAELTGLVVRAGGLEISLPDAIELRAAIHDLRRAGKTVACHAESATNAGYLVLAACDRIAIAPLGEVAITGPAAMPVHIKPLLDKLGIQADFLHVGAYKGAAEPLTLDAPSKQADETLGAILDRRYQTMVDAIAGERKLAPDAVKAMIDTALFPSDQARAAGLIDEVVAFEPFRDAAVHGAAWTRLTVSPDRGQSLAAMQMVMRFLGALPPDRPTSDHVALVYALGTIIDGSGDGVLGARAQIASHTLVAALRALTADDHVKAVVLRIDSGGGSAQASELIWRAVSELKARKPVIVSMSDVAASGGYYIASGATRIFALDDTLTGSIGVVGGKLALRGALARLGVHTFPVGRGKRATMMASLGPWTDDERGAVRIAMESVYRVFVGRVAAGRGKSPEDIDRIAQGRVWTGARARELGLIDEIGGLDAALAEARKLARLDAATGLEVYPPAPTLRDLAVGLGEVHA
ncbi:MAG TPA: signal peptide peptidase SppA, partial [Kofleriaceae bacterium]|nr:signal peptide peptidase SppA [Kofleriaceae bacterium]